MGAELSPGAWTAAVGASLLLHAGLAAGLASVPSTARVEKTTTEITFAEPEIASLPAAAPVGASSRAPRGEAERLAAAGVGESLENVPGFEAADPVSGTEVARAPGDPLLLPRSAASATLSREAAAGAAPVPTRETIAQGSPSSRLGPAQSGSATRPVDGEALSPAGAAASAAPVGGDHLPQVPAEGVATATGSFLPPAPADASRIDGPEASRIAAAAAAPVSSAAEAVVALAPSSPTVALPAATGGAERPVSAAPSREVLSGSPGSAPAPALPAASPTLLAPVPIDRLPLQSDGGADALTPTVGAGSAVSSLPSAAGAIRLPGIAAETARIVPDRPGVGGSGRGSAAWQDAVAFVRGFGGGGCFAALPAENGDRVGLEAFGADSGEMQRFADASGEKLMRPTTVAQGNLARIQCGAIELARASKLYPNFGLSIVLDPPRDRFDGVTGEIRGAGKREVQLLLIDEGGEVQTVERYAPGDEEALFFDFPFSREELAEARGLFIAVASDEPVANLRFGVAMKAPEFFRLLKDEVAANDIAIDIAMQAFDLR